MKKGTLKRCALVLLCAALFAGVALFAGCSWKPDALYGTEYTYSGGFQPIEWDDQGGWQFVLWEDQSENISPRAAIDRLKGEIDWQNVQANLTGTVMNTVPMEGVDTTDTDAIVAFFDQMVEAFSEQDKWEGARVTVGSEAEQTITIYLPAAVTHGEAAEKTFPATIIANGTQALFGAEPETSMFTLSYVGSTTKKYGASLQLSGTQVSELTGDQDSGYLETSAQIQFFGADGAQPLGTLFVYRAFTVKKA